MKHSPADSSPRPPATLSLESTASLLALVREGDREARERLVARFLPALRRWAHHRLPVRARGVVDTDDLVQVTLLRALNHVESFAPRREGAFLAYLRRSLLNAIRDELRRAARRPAHAELSEELVDRAPSLVEQAIGREAVERYEAALATLPELQQEAIMLRIEFQYSYREIAEAIAAPTANAARMTVARALVKLAEVMDGQRQENQDSRSRGRRR